LSVCAIVIVVTVFIYTCFLFCIANLLFSYSATQPRVSNKTQCQCQCLSVEVFSEARDRLSTHTVNYGYMESRDVYLRTLAAADVVVSTAHHEFFGVAMSVHVLFSS